MILDKDLISAFVKNLPILWRTFTSAKLYFNSFLQFPGTFPANFPCPVQSCAQVAGYDQPKYCSPPSIYVSPSPWPTSSSSNHCQAFQWSLRESFIRILLMLVLQVGSQMVVLTQQQLGHRHQLREELIKRTDVFFV